MNSCPNVSSPEWQKLVSVVGEMEAYRDFMTNGTVRDVVSVLTDIHSRTPEQNSKIQKASSVIQESIVKLNTSLANLGLTRLADTLSSNLGVSYQTISIADAYELLQDASTPYKNEPAFYYKDQVYFVEDLVNKDMVLHEFAHPLVRAIRAENPQLFEKLYEAAISTPGVNQIIESQYGDQSAELQKEEAIVRAMEIAEVDSNLWKRLLFAIKQLVRKVFGKQVKLGKLSKDTTLQELFTMMQTEKFDIEFLDGSNENIVSFIREQKELNDYLTTEASAASVEILLTNLKKFTSYGSRLVENEDVEKAIGEFLKTEDGAVIFNELKRELGEFQQFKNEEAKFIKSEEPTPADLAATVLARNVQVLSNSLGKLDILLSNLESAAFELSKDPSKAELIETQAILKIAQSAEVWVGTLEKLFKDAKVPSDNNVRTEVGRLGTYATRIQGEIRDIFLDFSIDFLYEENQDIKKEIDDYYQGRISQLEEELASGKNVKNKLVKLKRKYSEKAYTKENIRRALQNETDVNPAGAMLENFLNNPDPVIGGFATWFRKQAYKTQVKIQKQNNEFISKVLPVLKEAGYNPNKPQEFFKQLLFLDNSVVMESEFNEGIEANLYQLKDYQAWTLLNPYQNYLADKKKLDEKIERAQATNDLTTLRDLYQQRDEMNKFFHRPHTKEYYDAYEEYNTPAGKIARVKLDALYYELSQVDSKINKYELKDISQDDFTEKKLILREIRQLYSEVDVYGNPKKGEDLEVAKVLKSIREKTKDFFDFKEVPGLFETAYKGFLANISGDVEFGSPEYDALVEDWLEANTQRAVTDDYFDLVNQILDEISEIQEELGMSNSLKELYNTINDITKGFRDSANETEATALTPEAQKKVKQLQERINELRDNTVRANGLTNRESERLTELLTKKNDADQSISSEEMLEIKELFNKKKTLSGDPLLIQRLMILFQELSELRQTEPTEYYVEAIEAHLSRIKSEGTVKELFNGAFPEADSLFLNKRSVENLMTDPAFINTIKQDSEFAKWYDRNHVMTKKGAERTMVWNVKVPSDEAYFQSMTLPDGEVINRIPNRTFQERIVKEEYNNKREVGKTVDVWGNYLPDLSVPNNPYRNERYFKLKKENPSMFKALNTLSDWHLSKQESLNVSARLGYQVPRFTRDTLEFTQNFIDEGSIKGIRTEAAEKLGKAKNDIENIEFNHDAKMLATHGLVDDSLSKIPIKGVTKLDSKAVSLNVADSVLRYNRSAIMQEMLIETSPIAEMLLEVVTNAEAQDPNKYDKEIFKRTGQMVNGTYSKLGGYNSVRAMALNSFYEREYLGKTAAETWLDRGSGRTQTLYKVGKKASTMAMKVASTSYFAVNIPSAVKNRFAAIIQNNIEAVASDVLTAKGYALGKVTAKKAVAQVSSTIYSDKVKGKYVQIGQIFDIDGQLDKQKDAVSRTFGRDAVSLSWLMSPRKLLQMDATLELLYGMLHSKVIELKDGSKITLQDALQVRDGQLEVRPDTKEDWSLTSDNFLKFRILFQGKMNRLQGTYDQIDQPLFTKYLVGRWALFLRKYFISMFMNRFAAARIQYDVRTVEEGYYRGAGRFMYNLGVALHSTMTQDGTFAEFDRNTVKERTAMKKFGFDVLQQGVLLFGYKALMSILFGYDPDSDDEDERKTALLRRASGPLPLPGVESKYDFNPIGYFQLHAINQMMQVHQEAATFSPGSFEGGTPLGRSLLEMTVSPWSSFIKPSVGRMFSIASILNQTAKGDKSAYYSRDVGPWMWQKQGSSKFTKETLMFIGLNGKTVDPANGIVQWQQGQRLRMR